MIFIRTHSAEDIGFGHMVRCCRIADLLKSKNDIVFLIDQNKETKNFLKNKKFGYRIFNNSVSDNLLSSDITLILFDLRFFSKLDKQFIDSAREWGIMTIQITDLALEIQNTNHVIDASIACNFTKTNVNNKMLIGTDYLVLHHKFRHFFLKKKVINKNIKNIFISLGGSVPYRQLRKIIDILYRFNFNLKISPGFMFKKNQIKVLKRIYPKIKFTGEVESLARNFFIADLSICCSGISAYEAACCGSPALYFFQNKEQEILADYFERSGTGRKTGNLFDIDNNKLIEQIKQLNQEERELMSRNGKNITDGKGLYRIIDFLKNLNIINI